METEAVEDWQDRVIRTLRELLDAYDHDEDAIPSILVYIEELLLEHDERAGENHRY